MMNRKQSLFNSARSLLASLALVLVTASVPAIASAEDAATAPAAELQWIDGTGQQVPMGDISTLTLKEGYSFLDGANTKSYITQYGGLPSDTEIGALFPNNAEDSWAVYFEYEESGHIADDEKTDIDADALLESYKEGTEEANKELSEDNQLFVDGWLVPPAYNESLRSLTWALVAHDTNGEKIVNYNIRVLTRVGYISAILVSDPDHLDADRKKFELEVLPGLAINAGQKYEDYDSSTDKKAEYGLTGLILGGVGLAVAKKVGLLATILLLGKKFGIVLIAPIIWLWRKLRGRREQQPQPYQPPQVQPEQPQDDHGTGTGTGTAINLSKKTDENSQPPSAV